MRVACAIRVSQRRLRARQGHRPRRSRAGGTNAHIHRVCRGDVHITGPTCATDSGRCVARNVNTGRTGYRSAAVSGQSPGDAQGPTDGGVVGGSEEVKRVRRDFPKSTKIIFANSSDFSSTIRLVKNALVGLPSVIYLDTGFPGFPRDEIIEKTSEIVRSEDWYPMLSRFFDDVEKSLDLKVSISVHPKHIGRDHQPLFGQRETLGGQTAEVVSRCELVIATNSTAISYAIAFAKPLVLITSDKIEKSHNQYKSSLIQNISRDTGATIFNIDRQYSAQEIKAALVIDHKKYGSYEQKYLTSRTDGKPNYQVILEEIIKPQH